MDTTDPPYALVSILKRFGADNAGPMGLLESINGPLQDLWLTSSCLYTALQNTLYMNAVCNASVKPQNTISIPANNKGKDISSHPLQSRHRLSKDLKSARNLQEATAV